MSKQKISRRDALRTAGITATVGLAGCQTGATDDRCGTEPSSIDSTIPTAPIGSIPVSSSVGEWPTYQHDAGQTGFTTDAGPTDDVRLAWSRKLKEEARHSWPVVSNGTVVASCTNPGSVMALSPTDGSVEWSVDRLDIAGRPVVVENTVIVGDETGLHAFDLADGTERWTFVPDIESIATDTNQTADGTADTVQFSFTLANTDGTVFAQAVDESHVGVYAIAPDGTERWRKEQLYLEAVADGTAYLMGEPGLVAVNADTGKEHWSREETGIVGEMSVFDGTIYGDVRYAVSAIDAATGKTEWTFEGESETFISPTVTPDTVFVGSSPLESEDGGNLYALDRDTGDLLWCTYIGFRVVNPPVATANTVFVPTENAVEARAAESGELRWRYGTPDDFTVFQASAVTDGLLITGSEDGIIFAFAEV